MLVINTKDDTPVYIQLQNQILDYIALGILRKDEQLPSVRLLSKQLGINPNTVAKAYSNLEMQGYVYSKPAKGVFVKTEEVMNFVFENKITELKLKINDCRKVGIAKETLLQTVEEIYKEESQNAES